MEREYLGDDVVVLKKEERIAVYNPFRDLWRMCLSEDIESIRAIEEELHKDSQVLEEEE